VRSTAEGKTRPAGGASIDELLDRAVAAINRGDRATATALEIIGALELARRQTATLFELRAALDDFELRGKAATAAVRDAANRIPADSAWPELAKAKAALTKT